MSLLARNLSKQVFTRQSRRHFSVSPFAPGPPSPRVLGFLGLAPFVGTTAAAIVAPEFTFLAMEVQSVYSTTILSFMGAVHYGLAMAEYGNIGLNQSNAVRYSLSVTPALVAFFATILGNVPTALAVHLVSYNALLWADLVAARKGLVPSWYPGMRIWLTGIVSASIGGMLYLGYTKDQKDKEVVEGKSA
ncbi:hypothetical protein BCR33DRAFT_719615 [Rhizoclosmatium globosum]|uniref:Uncharacterized protein n=1 Tax=Rhizoclosmatium globosum TaxID=329046 RepID=A0A1Y2BZS0_9FUNG|nr:hypothetical protein BCR33DRAFT_719615 [Rhizoclosmatium globosum]|eukprot:ORY40259.1 hypothetical protein BCR33DRAFT_719615 [Rhizoclosmatium globosum]